MVRSKHYAEISAMLRRMPTRWRRAYNAARRTLVANGGPVLPDVPTPEQAMLILGNTAGGYRDIERPFGDQKVPQSVRDEALHGLRLSYKRDYPGSEFFGIARAIQLVLAPGIQMRARERMKRYLVAHAKDKLAPHFGDEERPSKGYMAWLNWGGDAAVAWNEDVPRATYSARTRGERRNGVSEPHRAEKPDVISFSGPRMRRLFVENPRRNPRQGTYLEGVERRQKRKGKAERAFDTAQTAGGLAVAGAKLGGRAIPVVGEVLMVTGAGKEALKVAKRRATQGVLSGSVAEDLARIGAGAFGLESFVPEAKKNPFNAFGPRKHLRPLSLPNPAEDVMIKVSPAQKAALKRIVRDVRALVKRGYTRNEIAKQHFGYGPNTDYTAPTIVALAARGFVVAHVGPPVSRPSRAGFGRPANARTVLSANRWFTLTARTLNALLPEGAE